jgi:hypothetical protein
VVTKAPSNSDEVHFTTQVKNVSLSADEFVKKIKREEKKVISAKIDGDVLNIFTADDGTNRKGLALYFCQVAKDNGLSFKGVNILEFDSKDFPPTKRKNGMYGRVLGSGLCDL